MTCLALVDDAAQREKSETVKQFEDGVTRLVDGEDDQSIVLHTPTAGTIINSPIRLRAWNFDCFLNAH